MDPLTVLVSFALSLVTIVATLLLTDAYKVVKVRWRRRTRRRRRQLPLA